MNQLVNLPSKCCASLVLSSSPRNYHLAWWRFGRSPLDTSSVWQKAQTPSNYYYYYYCYYSYYYDYYYYYYYDYGYYYYYSYCYYDYDYDQYC